MRDIPIERRDGRELSHIEGRSLSGALETVAILPEVSEVANYGFDVTPARLVPALITERGVGNGISLLIFAGIVIGLPNGVSQVFGRLRGGDG